MPVAPWAVAMAKVTSDNQPLATSSAQHRKRTKGGWKDVWQHMRWWKLGSGAAALARVVAKIETNAISWQ